MKLSETKVIGFLNQKGGVAKTTLSILATTAFSQNPYNFKVLAIEVDRQGTWIGNRNRELLEIKQENPESNIKIPYEIINCNLNELGNIVENSIDEYDMVFIDMPGSLMIKNIGEVLTICDIAFVPMQPSIDDVMASIDFIKFLIKAKELKEKNGSTLDIHALISRDDATTEVKEVRDIATQLELSILENTFRNLKAYRTKSTIYSIVQGKNLSKEALYIKPLLKEILEKIKN